MPQCNAAQTAWYSFPNGPSVEQSTRDAFPFSCIKAPLARCSPLMWQVGLRCTVELITQTLARSVSHFTHCAHCAGIGAKEQNCSLKCRRSHSNLHVTLHLGSMPVLPSSQHASVFKKIFSYKLMTPPNALNFASMFVKAHGLTQTAQIMIENWVSWPL